MSKHRQFSLRSKTVLAFLCVSLVSILVIAFLGSQISRTALHNAAFAHLVTMREGRADQVESYFGTLYNQIEVLAESETTVEALVRLNRGVRDLQQEILPAEWPTTAESFYTTEFFSRLAPNVEDELHYDLYRVESPAAQYLQHHYIVANENPAEQRALLADPEDGSEYSRWHARYHPGFRQLIQRFGYGDLYLITFETKTVIYSVLKDVDFATSLLDGPYARSALSEVVDRVRERPERGAVQVVDYERYEPHYAELSAFFAAPIYNGPHAIGIVAIRLPIEPINALMTGERQWQADGLGKTGEVYLVGDDLHMRSIARLFVDDRANYIRGRQEANMPQRTIDAMQQYSTTVLLQPVDTLATQTALGGEEGTGIIDGYRNVPVLSAYRPLTIPGLNWAILSEQELAEVNEPIVQLLNMFLMAAAVVGVILVLSAIVFATLFLRPVNALIAGARKAERGDEISQIHITSNDEFGELVQTFNAMVQTIHDQSAAMEQRARENEALLHSILPATVAARIRRGEETIADTLLQISVLVARLSGFVTLSNRVGVEKAAAILNEIVDGFDAAAAQHGLERQRAVGDVYVAVCGLTIPHLDHPKRTVNLAVELIEILQPLLDERSLHR